MFVKVNFAMSSWNLFEYLLEKGVNITPGELFGIQSNEEWIRICFCREEVDLVEGLSRIKRALAPVRKESDLQRLSKTLPIMVDQEKDEQDQSIRPWGG